MRFNVEKTQLEHGEKACGPRANDHDICLYDFMHRLLRNRFRVGNKISDPAILRRNGRAAKPAG
jgi:hypothetical protein